MQQQQLLKEQQQNNAGINMIDQNSIANDNNASVVTAQMESFQDMFNTDYTMNSAGVLTYPDQLSSDNGVFYDSVPKPEELDNFAHLDEKSSNPELFSLEEELGFGLDRSGTFNS
nr:hypothetical protein B9J08_002681 [[Candida] auris]